MQSDNTNHSTRRQFLQGVAVFSRTAVLVAANAALTADAVSAQNPPTNCSSSPIASMACVSGLDKGSEVRMALKLCALADLNAIPMFGETVAMQTARMRRGIDAYIANWSKAYPDWQNWEIAWGPGLNSNRGNMAYAAANRRTGDTALVIRGTALQFPIDSLENLYVFEQVPHPDVSDHPGIRIAHGTSIGLLELKQMKGVLASGNHVDLATFISSRSWARLFVTGHSLGGCLASAAVPWVAGCLGGAQQLSVYTFAAPSPGNKEYAEYYNRLFDDASSGSNRAYRFYNTLDVVPNAWASLEAIKGYYLPSFPCPDVIKMAVDRVRGKLDRYQYTQVDTPVALKGIVHTSPMILGELTFGREAAYQHLNSTYESLLRKHLVGG